MASYDEKILDSYWQVWFADYAGKYPEFAEDGTPRPAPQDLKPYLVGTKDLLRSNFGYWDERFELGEDSAIFWTTHRDVELIDESNWHTVIKRLNEAGFVEDEHYFILHCSHWLVGWMDHLVVKVDQYPVIDKLIEWRRYVEDRYLVLDDDDHSAREYRDSLAGLQNCLPLYHQRTARFPKNVDYAVEKLYDELSREGRYDMPYLFPQEKIDELCKQWGWMYKRAK